MGLEENFFGWMLLRMSVEIWALVFLLGSGLELLLSLGWLFLFGTEYGFPMFRVYLAAFSLFAKILGKAAGLDTSGFEDHDATQSKVRKLET